MENIKISNMRIFLLIIFISFFLININVVYFGDDYFFLGFRNLDILSYFQKLGEHYLKDNGRLIVHFFDTIILSISPVLWQFLNSFMLTGICYFASSVICYKKEDNQKLVLLMIFVLIALIDISVTRQSIYWITGSFNYVYPILMLLIYWNLLINAEQNKKYFILAIVFGVLASASVEQARIDDC